MAKHKMEIVQTILNFLLVASFVFYFVGEVALPQENFWERNSFGEYWKTNLQYCGEWFSADGGIKTSAIY